MIAKNAALLLVMLVAGIFILSLSENVHALATIEIKSFLKEGTFIHTNLYFPVENTTLTFGGNQAICPTNNCKYELTDGTFNDAVIGPADKYLSGTLKIEDKANSNGDTISFKYYKMSGTMTLIGSKENQKTGEKINNYEGDLGTDVKDPIFFPSVKYTSKVSYNENDHMFILTGTKK